MERVPPRSGSRILYRNSPCLCPNCGAWNQMEEKLVHKETKGRGTFGKPEAEGRQRSRKLERVNKSNTPRTLTQSGEFDRVLGGGIVDGSLIESRSAVCFR